MLCVFAFSFMIVLMFYCIFTLPCAYNKDE